MISSVAPYIGKYKKYTVIASFLTTLGIVASVVPYFFLYQLIVPLTQHQLPDFKFIAIRVALIFVCEAVYAIAYSRGLAFSHISAYNTLKNIRISLKDRLERQPLGNIKELGTGHIKRVFTDDIDQIELLLAHAIPEGIANLLVPCLVFVAMFVVDWRLALLTLAVIPIGIFAMSMMMNGDPVKAGNSNFKGKNYDVEFKNVRFSYKKGEDTPSLPTTEVLHDISLTLKQGSTTALIGESGSGKSTLAKLLVHFYDLDSGAISIGGQDITDMSIEALNNQVSYVAQEQFLFNTTLYENILIGRPNATREEVLDAAHRAQCDEFLERFPKGIDTMAGDSGKQLSGGERQRISLARAILKNAPIIVLDEATAFIDPENEEKMNAAISEIVRDKTVLVIAHRLSSIKKADKICVLKDGNVIAEGKHSTLNKESEEYKKLWKASKAAAEWKI